MRILMTGGTGLIGQALASHWQSQGHDIVVVSREPTRVPLACPGAVGVGSFEQLGVNTGFDAVINLAGAPIADGRWTSARRHALWASRVDLTKRLVAWMGAQAYPPPVLLSASAVGWYGDCGERELDEASEPGPQDFGAQLCHAWEDAARSAQAHGTRVAVLRLAPVLARSGGLLARLRLPYLMGLGGPLGNGQQWMPWIHMQDVLGAADHLLAQTSHSGAFNLCAPQPVRNQQFSQALGQALHRPSLLPAPAALLRLGLGEMSVLLLGGQRVLPSRLQDSGYVFRQPRLSEALADALKPASAGHPVDKA